jgi:DNA-binding NarL/FixJ family response regulator
MKTFYILFIHYTQIKVMMKIYIVEDSKMMVERITTTISPIPGVDIIGVSDNEQKAVSEVESLHPELMIVDIRLREGDGMNLLKYVKGRHPEIIVAMFTNYSLPEFKDRCMSLGADYFFDKSKDFYRIIKIVAQRSFMNAGNTIN